MAYWAEHCQGWVYLLQGQRLQVHHLISKGSGGNLRHISRPGSQDHARMNVVEVELTVVQM